MSIYRNLSKDIIRGAIEEATIIIESVKVENPDEYGYSKTNLKINGVSVTIINRKGSTLDDNQKIANQYLEKDFKILKSNFSDINKKVKLCIEELCEEWEEPKSNYKYAHFDTCLYYTYPNKGISEFKLWWNNEPNSDRAKLLDGHSISIIFRIKDGKGEIDSGVSL